MSTPLHHQSSLEDLDVHELYREAILEEYQHPQHRGRLANADLTCSGKNASCGDEVQMTIVLAGQQVQDLKWEGSGCAISQASMSLFAGEVVRRHLTLNEVCALTSHELLAWLGLPSITPGREKCLTLGLRTLQRAIAHQK